MDEAEDADQPILLRSRALQGLVVLREAELANGGRPTPMGAGEWSRKLDYTKTHGAKARKYLKARNTITVEEGIENRVIFVRLLLTPKGRDIADHAIAIRKLDAKR